MCKSQSGGEFHWLIPTYCVTFSWIIACKRHVGQFRNIAANEPDLHDECILIPRIHSLKQVLEIEDSIISFGGLLLIQL